MNQQNQGPSIPSNVPMKRKRGRPRKEENVVHKSENVLNFNQPPTGQANGSDGVMLGKVVTGVIEASFNDGYLVNVKVAETDSFLRGVVFLPGQVIPVTAENDVAPHVQMIKRKEFPIPMVNPQVQAQTTEVHGALTSLQPIGLQIQVPLHREHALPTEIISVPPGISEPEHVNQSSSLKSELECDKTVKQGDKLHELDVSTQVEKLGFRANNGGAEKESRPVASETMNLFPVTGNTDKELRTEQQVFPSVHQLNELVHDEPNSSNTELNLVPLCAEPESMQSEQTSKSVENFVEKQNLPETDSQEDANTKLLSIETLSKVDNNNLNSNGKPSTGIANILDAVPNHTVEISQPESMPSEQFVQSADLSDSKLASDQGCEFMEKSDSQNCSSLGDINKVIFNHPNQSFVDAVPSENQIGSGT
ncbi:uncharacterized protein [Cicer arietinum]|uniref:Uncharacterized protein LOC101501851 n=1 Tax=Cicer arietinum TaxID=3827 RepID=A0A1S2YNY1_CICAR|nr:uncharacterized protein LOC101501851 [Cicer arietinum]